MFSRPAFTCNFWGPWEGRTRLSPLPATILARPATASEQNLRVQKELVQHRAAWPRFWTLWWRKLAPVGETNSEGGWGTRSESDSECDWAASQSPPPASAAVLHAEARVQLPNPSELIQRICAPVSPPPSVAASEPRRHQCACGERGCDRFPDCISALADLLSQDARKRPRVE